eukprot:c8926_g1_i1 orf=105-272(+)
MKQKIIYSALRVLFPTQTMEAQPNSRVIASTQYSRGLTNSGQGHFLLVLFSTQGA